MAFQPGIDFGTLDFNCPDCGGTMRYAGDRKSATCASCGFKRNLSGETEFVTPRALTERINLAAYPIWKPDFLFAHKCGSCKATWLRTDEQTPGKCPGCGATDWSPEETAGKWHEPAGLVPATVTASGAKGKLRKHIGFHLLHPPEIRKVPDALSLTYVPVWLVDAYARTSWIAEVGFEYEEEKDGKKEKKSLKEFLRGYLEKFFDRLEVPASSFEKALQSIFPYTWGQAIKPQPVYFKDAWVEGYKLDGKSALVQAEKEMDKQLEVAVSNKIPGATFNDLELITEKSLLALRHILVPVWVVPFSSQGKKYQYLVNAVTGKVTGAKPLSSIRVGVAIAILVGSLLLITLAVAAFFKR